MLSPSAMLRLFTIVLITTKIVAQNTISDSLNSFSIQLLTAVSNEGGESLNLALSPYTVWTIMSVIAEGATGDTLKQLNNVLHLPYDKRQFHYDFSTFAQNLRQSSQNVEFVVSNNIFTTSDQRLIPLFRDTAEKYYNVYVRPMNFRDKVGSAATINNKIAETTKGRIQNFILPDDLMDAQMFLTSALYFRGTWRTPFNRTATRVEPFYNEHKQPIGSVQLMYQSASYPFSRLEFLRAFAIELPYGNNDKTSMILILPFTDNTVEQVLRDLSKLSGLNRIIDMLKKAEEDYMDDLVDVYLPRFSAVSDLNLNVVLEKMGMRDVFNEDKVELLGILPHYLCVSRVIHRAEIDVDEDGTVASGATGAGVQYKTTTPKFRADKPFIYFIIDKPSRGIIFSGKISNPNGLR